MLTSEQVETYNKDGFLIVKRMLSLEEINPVTDALRQTNVLDDRSIISSNKDFSGNDSFHAAFWRDPTGSTLLAKLPMMSRLVNSAEQLLNNECYYWRSRLVFKNPNEAGRIEYHQDYSFWYRDGCVFPDMISCSVAVTESTVSNGCLEILRGSHRVGRLDLTPHIDGAEYPDPLYVKKIAERHERVYCELEPGDALFFHANSMHGSGPNTTGKPRVLLHHTYNAAFNVPIRPTGQSDVLAESQKYEPAVRVPDDFILAGQFDEVFDRRIFFPSEMSATNEVGIFKRPGSGERRKN